MKLIMCLLIALCFSLVAIANTAAPVVKDQKTVEKVVPTVQDQAKKELKPDIAVKNNTIHMTCKVCCEKLPDCAKHSKCKCVKQVVPPAPVPAPVQAQVPTPAPKPEQAVTKK